MLTEHQLEIAARKLCELSGKNPDEQIEYLQGHMYKPPLIRWEMALNAITQNLQVQQAIAYASAQQEPT